MNLRHLSDHVLLHRTKELVRQERKLLLELLYHLREIDQRRLFSQLKFKSLNGYAVSHLGYPEDQAGRRIAAMQLLKELPELDSKIASGALNLTHLGMAKVVFNKKRKQGQKYSRSQKLDFLEQVENKSIRQAARVVASVAPEALTPDRIRAVSADQIEVKFVAPAELQSKLEHLKGLLAHSDPQISLAELIDKLYDLGVKEWSKSVTKTAAPRDRQRQNAETANRKMAVPNESKDRPQPKTSTLTQAEIHRQVWRRDKVCTNCKSTFALEIDHCLPRAKGGDSTLENLRILCRSCNQRAAIDAFGVNKMANFLKSPEVRYG